MSNNTISFNSNESVHISLNIHLQTSNASINNIFGNLFLYYKKNESDSPTQIGYQSITFYLNTYYINDTPFDVTLFKSSFFENGGILYAEYKSNENKTYESNKISITGGSLPSPAPIVTPINETISTQNLRYSDNFPIVNSKIFLTPDTPTFIDIEVQSKNEGDYTSIGISLDEMIGNSINKTIPLKSIWIAPDNNFHLLKDIQINPSALNFNQYTYILKVKTQHYRITSNAQIISSKYDYVYKDNNRISVLLSKPIENNIIKENQTLASGQVSSPFTSLPPKVDYTINCDRRGCTPIYDIRYIDNFQWQTRTQNTNWTDIPQAIQKDYSPNKTFAENTYYRRIAFYIDGQYNISNTLSIIINNETFQNTICCNQQLPLSTSQPEEISGNAPNLSNFTYQWQICAYPLATSRQWEDLPNATAQNYKHIFTTLPGRDSQSTLFRRLIKKDLLAISISNEIDITRAPRVQGVLNTSNTSQLDNDIVTYPNPFIDNFSIDGSINIDQVKLYDSYGQPINIKKIQSSKNKIEVNTTNLKAGAYILKVDDTNFSKTLLKN
ncbi:hypothetical protein FF52_19080 [Flavobacterium sp. F52]|nr:hypothetical protein FF52_19080 [Flavobacterium sp. F52]